MPIKVEAWKCDGCGMVSRYKSNTKRHEKSCFNRLENKACKTCTYWHFEYEDKYTGHQFGEATYNAQEIIMWCDKDVDLGEAVTHNDIRMNCELHKVNHGLRY